MKKIMHLVPVHKYYSETFIWDLIDYGENYYQQLVVASNLNVSSSKLIKISGKDSNLINKIRFNLYSRFFPCCYFSHKKLDNVINDFEPDVIHAHFGYFVSDFIWLLKNHTTIRFVISFHGTDLNTVIRKRIGLLSSIRKISQNENITCVFPSEFLRKSFFKVVGNSPKCHLVVIPNAVKAKFISSWLDSYSGNFPTFENKLSVLSVGRLTKVKGFEYVIRCIPYLISLGINVNYKIIGDGEERKRLYKIAVNLGVDRNVSFLGSYNSEQIIEEIKMAHIYIQSSVRLCNGQEESFGVSALEASVSGIPTIVTSTGGLMSVIDDLNPNHHVIRPNSTSDIVETILRILNTGYIHYNGNSHNNKFLLKDIYKSWLQVYENNN